MKQLLFILLFPVSLFAQKIEAEAFTAMKGVQVELTTDSAAGKNLSYIDKADYMDYTVSPAIGGKYEISYRVASLNGSAFTLTAAKSGLTENITIPKTGGYQSWVTIKDTVMLLAGSQTLRITSTNANYWNINWLNIRYLNPVYIEAADSTITVDLGLRRITTVYDNGASDTTNLPARPKVLKQ